MEENTMKAIREDGQVVELSEAGTWRFSEDRNTGGGEDGFRGVKWGTSPEVAKRREDSPPSEELETILYWTGGRLGGLSCEIVYIYANASLVRAKYIINEEWVNENRFIMEYNAMSELLSKKYGRPESENEFWNNELWKDEYDDWGKAVQQGHLSMYATWYSGETRIMLSLFGENYESSLQIEYASIRLEKIESRLKEAELLDIL
ncbi:hypothetical protein ACH82I_17675 [Brevibacterium sp. GP-SGM9]|uniref:hypothetical protein n=1 Tax=Brevibacterium sp. GP-SGM9 TaxID=3376990 RepID=UPI0039A5232C